MKKIFSILSLCVITLSNLTSGISFALTYQEEVAIEKLNETLNELVENDEKEDNIRINNDKKNTYDNETGFSLTIIDLKSGEQINKYTGLNNLELIGDYLPTWSEDRKYKHEYYKKDGDNYTYIGERGILSYRITEDLTFYRTNWEKNGKSYTEEDGSYTFERSNKKITVAKNNLEGEYYWGYKYNTTISGDYSEYQTHLDGHDNDWGGENDTPENGYNGGLNKNRQGPCPDGWHIPSRGEWNDLFTIYCHLGDNECISEAIIYENNSSNIDSIVGGKPGVTFPDLLTGINVGQYERLRTSTPKPDTNFSFFITHYNSNFKSSNYEFGRMSKKSVRCFKNMPLTVIYNANGGVFSGGYNTKNITYNYSGTEIIPIYNIEIPNRTSEDMLQQSGWMFAGWYTKDGIDGDWGEELNLQRPQAKRAYAKWLPFNDLDLDVIGLSGVKIMDRNMGAEAVAEGIFYGYGNVPHESNSLLGYFYQWGNNYGFTSSGDLLEGEGSHTQISNQFHSTNPWGPSNPFYNNVFIMRRYTTSYSRSVEDNRNLRGGSSVLDKDKKGPCPEGYHIPDKSERDFVKNSFMALKSDICDENSSQLGSCFARSLKLPYAGYRAYDYSRLRSQGGLGNYWLSTSYNKNKAYYFSFSDNALNISSDYITYGKSVRCFKDSLYRLTFNLDNGDKVVYSKKWRNPIDASLKPQEQIRPNAEFLGRGELDRDDLFKFGPDVFLTGDLELYPKFKCNFGYTESQDGKSCDKIVVNYFSDNKLVASMSPVINSIEVPVTGETYSFTGENQFLEYKENDFLNILRQIQKPGYKIEGWYYSGMQEKFNYETVSTGEVINVYAKWEPITYTMSFNLNGGVGNINEVVATYGEQINLPTPARQGYVFKGWQSEDGIVFNGFISEGTGATTVDGSTIMLTAVWESIANSLSAGGGSTIKSVKAENEVTKLEHNSADIESSVVEESKSEYNTAVNELKNDSKLQQRSLTRGEVAVMTNILLDVFPELINGNQEIEDVTNACTNYTDEQKFTKDERKAITRLCKLSIMGIHSDNNEPLDEFMVNQWTKNDEFSKVINRSISTYNEKDLSVVKEALKKLEDNEENVEFGTVYNVFMSIKELFN